MQKPSIPKGHARLLPAEMMRRQYIFDTIRRVFRAYGFAPLETPSMENLSTLLGKYGDEGDKLPVQDSQFGRLRRRTVGRGGSQRSKICEKRTSLRPYGAFRALRRAASGRTDVPLQTLPDSARVARADRPQKGRYREFYQCDVDVIGTRSLLCEVNWSRSSNGCSRPRHPRGAEDGTTARSCSASPKPSAMPTR